MQVLIAVRVWRHVRPASTPSAIRRREGAHGRRRPGSPARSHVDKPTLLPLTKANKLYRAGKKGTKDCPQSWVYCPLHDGLTQLSSRAVRTIEPSDEPCYSKATLAMQMYDPELNEASSQPSKPRHPTPVPFEPPLKAGGTLAPLNLQQILYLQRGAGNRAVSRLLTPRRRQETSSGPTVGCPPPSLVRQPSGIKWPQLKTDYDSTPGAGRVSPHLAIHSPKAGFQSVQRFSEDHNKIHADFYRKHLRSGTGKSTLDKIKEGLRTCESRLGGGSAVVNTVLYLSDKAHDAFLVEKPLVHGDNFLSIVYAQLAVDLGVGDKASITVGPRFLYGVRQYAQGMLVNHLVAPGTFGGESTSLEIERNKVLVAGRRYKDPTGRGRIIRRDIVHPGVNKKIQKRRGNDVGFVEVRLVASERDPRKVGGNFWVKEAKLNFALSERWFTYRGLSYKI